MIAVAGDCATTTVLALAVGWPSSTAPPDSASSQPGAETLLIEADPRGGSLSAWLDTPATPSLSTVVTALHQAGDDERQSRSLHWATIDPLIQRSPAGPRFIPAPIRSREARTAVHEASHSLFPVLARTDQIVALVDTGALDLAYPSHAFRYSATTVLCHRQETASAQAAAARLERLAEQAEALTAAGHHLTIALIGDQPFALDEVMSFVAADTTSWTLPLDPLAAAVLAGRRGVSGRRLARLPLIRAAGNMAAELAGLVDRRAQPDPTGTSTPANSTHRVGR